MKLKIFLFIALCTLLFISCSSQENTPQTCQASLPRHVIVACQAALKYNLSPSIFESLISSYGVSLSDKRVQEEAETLSGLLKKHHIYEKALAAHICGEKCVDDALIPDSVKIDVQEIMWKTR